MRWLLAVTSIILGLGLISWGLSGVSADDPPVPQLAGGDFRPPDPTPQLCPLCYILAGSLFSPSPAPQFDLDIDPLVYDLFVDGYVAGGRDAVDHIRRMVWCESEWRLETDGIFLGLAQFSVESWDTVSGLTGFTDWRHPYAQGFNVATWIELIDEPGSSSGWPVCWWR